MITGSALSENEIRLGQQMELIALSFLSFILFAYAVSQPLVVLDQFPIVAVRRSKTSSRCCCRSSWPPSSISC
jgi:hypothetical protein